jgi:hypothetical protein
VRSHIPKVDTGDDYDFMCGTCAFGAMISARDLCQSCTKRTLEIVELLADAYDELKPMVDAARNANHPATRRRRALLRQIDNALGKRPMVDYATEES